MIKLSKDDIIRYLTILGERLDSQGITGEMLIIGGAAMALLHDSRGSTVDIDALYSPKSIIEVIASRMAKEYELPDNWLNDNFSDFITAIPQNELYITVPGLVIHSVTPKYLLTMKLFAGRDEPDIEDIIILLKKLGIETADEINETLSLFSSDYEISKIPTEFINRVITYMSYLETDEAKEYAELDYFNEQRERLLQLKQRRNELESTRREVRNRIIELETRMKAEGKETLFDSLSAELYEWVADLDNIIRDLNCRITEQETKKELEINKILENRSMTETGKIPEIGKGEGNTTEPAKEPDNGSKPAPDPSKPPCP